MLEYDQKAGIRPEGYSMRRREFIVLAGGLATGWPLVASAQQSSVPVVGFFRSTPAKSFAQLITAFREGLKEAGYVDGENVAIEYRWADNHLDRLPGLAADLVQRKVTAIVGNGLAVRAAKDATATIPIVFVLADDPVKSGLVTSLSCCTNWLPKALPSPCCSIRTTRKAAANSLLCKPQPAGLGGQSWW
jgi:ABC-type uncharacterized transport system substrate-binding protein